MPGTKITRQAPLSVIRTGPTPIRELEEPGTIVNVPKELTMYRSKPITAYTVPAISHIPRIGFVNAD
ncbi:MAG: hypothetical protein ACRD6W_01370 [Nitrososphaerales archaeon]